MHLRPATQVDATFMQALYDESYPGLIPKANLVIEKQQVQIIENPEGQPVGFRALSETGFVWIAVVANSRRTGIGRLLMQDALSQAVSLGLPELTSRVAESPAVQAFCGQFRFKYYVYGVNLSLDLTHWDESPLVPKLEQARQSGVQFVTFAELGDTPENRQRLYSLNKTYAATIPREERQEFLSFEAFQQWRFSAARLPPDGIIVAIADSQWVGMTQVSFEGDYAFTQTTGVLPEYRGRGIAQALKLLSLRFAKDHGQTLVRTFNDVGNAPMLAVNEQAGFHQEERFYLVRRKPLIDAT